MKNRIKLIALIIGIFIAFAFPLFGANAVNNLGGASAVVDSKGEYCDDRVEGITADTEKYIAKRNQNLEKNCKGAQICVLVLDTIGSQRIEDYSAMVFEKWKIGRNGENNGVLLLMATEDKDYYIIAGSGLSSVLSTKILSDISRNAIEPYFSEGEYDKAVETGFKRLNEAVCNHYKVDPFASVEGNNFFSGGGSGIFGTGSGLSCADIELSTSPILDCASCLFCGSCGACGSCAGSGSLIFGLLVAYVILQVLKYIGKSKS